MSHLPAPSLSEAFAVWTKIGFLSFGGPSAQIALMHKEIVEDKKWLTEEQYLGALSFCILLPGPEAMQLATYVGWRLHGVMGGLIAGLMFIIPGALVVLTLAGIYASFGNVPFVEALFLGIKATVIIIVIEALLRISKKALKGTQYWILAALSFVGIFFLALPFPVIILLAAAWGYFRTKPPVDDLPVPHGVSTRATLKTIGIWLGIWLGPLLALTAIAGPTHILSGIGWFFSKLAVVTFGGAYAVLAYMGQDVVVKYSWLSAGQMMDGLGLAETTPGPLILVTEFVGYVAAFQQGGFWLAVAGALVALWATFAPCFLWIFAGGPYIEWITAQPRLKGALQGITAAVVGVILNLAIWFGLHVFFDKVEKVNTGIWHLWVPQLASLNPLVLVLAALAAWLLLFKHRNMVLVLGICASMSLLASMILPATGL